MRNRIIDLVKEIAKDRDGFEKLERALDAITRAELRNGIIECGILPECFDHDSSEEKMWAKFSDILLAKSLTQLNIPSRIVKSRGDSADVVGETGNYSMVGDAKTFRLSRTAKNQKDFKVQALDGWREGRDYAVLVSPLTQYPNEHSQIYEQAITRNVTLLSYTHMSFLLEYYREQDLRPLWRVGESLSESLRGQDLQKSESYWNEVDRVVLGITNINADRLNEHKREEIEKVKQIGEEEIRYWEGIIESYQHLPQREAVRKLIVAEKIEAKIKTIRREID